MLLLDGLVAVVRAIAVGIDVELGRKQVDSMIYMCFYRIPDEKPPDS